MEKFDALDQDTQKEVARSVPQFVLNMIEGIQKICNERDEQNLATESKLPIVLQHQWIKLGTSDIVRILRLQHDRLLVIQDRELMRLIEEDHKGLKRAISKKTTLRQIFEEHDCHRSISEGWESVKTHFLHLAAFSDGLVIVFPGTAVVESDISVLKDENHSFRTGLLDLILEGIMDCKQYGALLQRFPKMKKIIILITIK